MGKSYNNYGSYSGSWNLDPKMAFAHPESGIKFFGGGKTKYESFNFTKKDLLINLTGTKLTIKPPKPFVKTAPQFLSFLKGNVEDKHFKDDDLNQLLLDWTDMKAPPSDIEQYFWQNIYNACVETGIERVLICCTAGKGRTGTALASFLVSLDIEPDPLDAIEFVREKYNSEAIERSCQEEYICELSYDFDMADYEEWSKKNKKSHSSSYSSSGTSYGGDYKKGSSSTSMVVHKSTKSGSKMGPYKKKDSPKKGTENLGADIEGEIWMAWEKHAETKDIKKYDMDKYDEFREKIINEQYSDKESFIVTKTLDSIKFDDDNTPEDWENFFKSNDYILKISKDNDPKKSTITYNRTKISM
jgi:protein-tyrosine phosphatase